MFAAFFLLTAAELDCAPTLLLRWRGEAHRHDTVKGRINRWESRKWKLRGVPLPANNLAIHSSL